MVTWIQDNSNWTHRWGSPSEGRGYENVLVQLHPSFDHVAGTILLCSGRAEPCAETGAPASLISALSVLKHGNVIVWAP